MQKNSVLHVSRKKKKIAHTCKNEFYWTIVGYSLLVLVHFWMSNQPKEFFVFDTMFLPPKNKTNLLNVREDLPALPICISRQKIFTNGNI